jgi:hypothetical protein
LTPELYSSNASDHQQIPNPSMFVRGLGEPESFADDGVRYRLLSEVIAVEGSNEVWSGGRKCSSTGCRQIAVRFWLIVFRTRTAYSV